MRPAMASAEVSSPEFAGGCSDILKVDFVSTEGFSLRFSSNLFLGTKVGTRCARFDLTLLLGIATPRNVPRMCSLVEASLVGTLLIQLSSRMVLAEFGTYPRRSKFPNTLFKSWAGSNELRESSTGCAVFHKSTQI